MLVTDMYVPGWPCYFESHFVYTCTCVFCEIMQIIESRKRTEDPVQAQEEAVMVSHLVRMVDSIEIIHVCFMKHYLLFPYSNQCQI